MQEVLFRLNDYFFYQFLYAATDANPYWNLIERLTEEVDPFADHEPNKSSSVGGSG